MGAGIKGLLDDARDITALGGDGTLLEERHLDADLADPKRGSMILIQFLSLSPKLTVFEKKSVESNSDAVPSAIYTENYLLPG